MLSKVWGAGAPSSGAAHLYGDVKHEARLSRVGHAHHPDPIGIAHAHLLWGQRESQCQNSDGSGVEA